MMDMRRKYAYNMFDGQTPKSDELTAAAATDRQRKNEGFIDNYRHYSELINLRQKWTFFQAALTTVYYPAKKDISLDKILTFLEYRHVCSSKIINEKFTSILFLSSRIEFWRIIEIFSRQMKIPKVSKDSP